jgi:hypothetical protein
MLANMLRTIQGERYSISPFVDYATLTKKVVTSPKQKIAALKEMEKDVGVDSLGKIFDSFFEDEIRNAFYHSDYTLYANQFRYQKRATNWKLPTAAPITDLTPKIDQCINFYLAFMKAYDDHRQSYTESKIIKGRFAPDGGWLDIEILVQKDTGVTGFRSPPVTQGT